MRFAPQSNKGIVMVSMPKQARFIGIVFVKIQIPEGWFLLFLSPRYFY